jgi:hypothetical protein
MERRPNQRGIRGSSLHVAVLAVVTVLSLTVVSVSADGASLAGLYAGTTSQFVGTNAFRISMNVTPANVADVQFGAFIRKGPASCKVNSSDGITFDLNGVLAIHNGRFDGKLKNRYGGTVVLQGTVTSTSVEGSFTAVAPDQNASKKFCNSGVVTYVAQASSAPKGNAQYSGTSGPGYPLTFQISSDGTAVDNLVVAFEETCNGSAGNVAPKFDFKTLAITNGEFSGTTIEAYNAKNSDTLHISGSFNGGVATGQVSDTSRIFSLPTCTEVSSFQATPK